jgi:putative membrane protein
VTADGLAAVVIVLALFCLWHASSALGPRLAVVFFAITAMTCWAFEEVGVLTGLVYGPYHYTSTLGPWIGSVPVLIPLAWFALVYPTHVVVDLAADRWSAGPLDGRGRLLVLALIGAVAMAAWDLALDPVLSGPVYRAWIWETAGPGTGIPVQNSVGWIATAFTVYVVFRSLERRSAPGRRGDEHRGAGVSRPA